MINKVSDKVQKDYTRELNELNKLDNSLETNSNEEKISPNCLVILKNIMINVAIQLMNI